MELLDIAVFRDRNTNDANSLGVRKEGLMLVFVRIYSGPAITQDDQNIWNIWNIKQETIRLKQQISYFEFKRLKILHRIYFVNFENDLFPCN